MEQADLELRGLRVSVERSLVGEQRGPQPEHRPVVLEGQLPVHMEIAGEAGADEVLRAVLDPLDRPTEQERRGRCHHVSRVHRHLVPEAAAEVGGDDPDVLLREPGDQREHGSDRVRRLRGHVDRRLSGGPVHVRDAPARLERCRVRPRIERVEADDSVGRGERSVRRVRVPGLPVVDVVVGLSFLLVPDDRGIGCRRLLR